MIFFITEIIGTIAFAISGATVAVHKRMDIFGVVILGMVTAVGGGVLRDLLLGITPPEAFRHPVYAVTAIAVSLIIFLPSVRRRLDISKRWYPFALLLSDSLGLGVFTAIGATRALYVSAGLGLSSGTRLFMAVFMGTVTGVGGGVIRDLLAADTPSILVKHFYACAAIAGAIVSILCFYPLGRTWAIVIGAAATVILRMTAARYRWSLPRAR